MQRYTIQRIRNLIQDVLIEGKIEDLALRYPNINVNLVASKDPTSTKKYLFWMLKQLQHGASLKEIALAITEYDQKIARATIKDINAFQNLKSLQQELTQINKTKSSKETRTLTKSGGVKLVENDVMVFLLVTDREAAMSYGSGTKWCISMARDTYFEDKSAKNDLFYFRLDKTRRADSYNKLCIQVFRDPKTSTPDGTFVIWDAQDNDVNIDDVRENIPDIDHLLKLAMKDAAKRPITIFAASANSELTKKV